MLVSRPAITARSTMASMHVASVSAAAKFVANAQQFLSLAHRFDLLARFHSSAWTLAAGEFTACNVMPAPPFGQWVRV